MSKLSRRKFIGTVAAGAGAALVGGAALPSEGNAAAALGPVDPNVKSPTDRVNLGRSGLKVSLVGIGTGSIGYARHSNQTQLGQESFTKMMRHALDRGVNFFDLADAYGSHPFFREAMRGVERSRYVIQTKTDSRDPREAAADVDRFLKELDTDYIDSLIIHCVTEGDWTTSYRGVLDVFSEAKRKGKVRAVGVTCHSFEALEAAAASDWVEINQVRWNPRAAHMDAEVDKARELFRRMRARGQGMIGMKVVGQGDIVRGGRALTPTECFRFQIESGVVDAFVVGVESVEHIDELLGGTQLALNELGYRAATAA
ncbi:MAG: 1-deoxyxylulose-5-phosphate synthase [Acidobacteriota bacterium]|jgi:aryl-alcohol dehydrogenase-like predicted oxidoreductase|nr:1-deoxyxylulose-5-phosphate synthase [Acidobacteriota bacterium]